MFQVAIAFRKLSRPRRSACEEVVTIRWRMVLLLAFVLIWGVPNTYAQRIEVAPFFGSRFGGTIDLTHQSNPNADFMKIKSSINYGILTDISFLRHFQGEFTWSRQPTSLTVHNPNNGTYTFLSKMNLDMYQIGLAYQFRKPEAKVRPFIVLGLGFSHYGIPAINGRQPFAGSLGGGVKYYFTRNFGIRMEGRWLTTDTTYKGMQTCTVITYFAYNSYTCPANYSTHQEQVNMGLIFRFK
jgi:hypothetical protein